MPGSHTGSNLSRELINQVAEGVQLSANQRQANLNTHIWWAVKDLTGEARQEWKDLVTRVGEQKAILATSQALVDPSSIKETK